MIKGIKDIAKQVLNKVIEINPNNIKPYSNLANIFVGEGNLKKQNFLRRV